MCGDKACSLIKREETNQFWTLRCQNRDFCHVSGDPEPNYWRLCCCQEQQAPRAGGAAASCSPTKQTRVKTHHRTYILPISVRWWNQAQSLLCHANGSIQFFQKCLLFITQPVNFYVYIAQPHLPSFPQYLLLCQVLLQHNSTSNHWLWFLKATFYSHRESNTPLHVSVHGCRIKTDNIENTVLSVPQRTWSSRSVSLCWRVALRSEAVLNVLSPFGCQARRHHIFSLRRCRGLFPEGYGFLGYRQCLGSYSVFFFYRVGVLCFGVDFLVSFPHLLPWR